MSGADARYTNLYMKNLDLDITDTFLKERFSSFGQIISLAVAKDSNGMSKGFGFVNFDNPDDAKKAIEAMNGLQLGSYLFHYCVGFWLAWLKCLDVEPVYSLVMICINRFKDSLCSPGTEEGWA
jgi:hypothetical protein